MVSSQQLRAAALIHPSTHTTTVAAAATAAATARHFLSNCSSINSATETSAHWLILIKETGGR